MAHSATTHPVRGSTRAVTWAIVEPLVTPWSTAASAHHGHERLVVVGVVETAKASAVVEPDVGAGPGVTGGQDAPDHRGQMGGEQDRGTEALLHLGGVAVVEQPVGHEVLVHRREVQVARRTPRRPPRPRSPRPRRVPGALDEVQTPASKGARARGAAVG